MDTQPQVASAHEHVNAPRCSSSRVPFRVPLRQQRWKTNANGGQHRINGLAAKSRSEDNLAITGRNPQTAENPKTRIPLSPPSAFARGELTGELRRDVLADCDEVPPKRVARRRTNPTLSANQFVTVSCMFDENRQERDSLCLSAALA